LVLVPDDVSGTWLPKRVFIQKGTMKKFQNVCSLTYTLHNPLAVYLPEDITVCNWFGEGVTSSSLIFNFAIGYSLGV
jgi:hypothetical protein